MSRNSERRIAIVGIGYVGLVTAIALAELGHTVHCLDIDAAKIARLELGEAPFHEPGLHQALANQRTRMDFSTEVTDVLGRVDVAVVCVDTPPTATGHADLSRVESVIDMIPTGARLTLVMKSTVPVGTGQRLQRRMRARGLHQVSYVANPEFLREGSALADVRHPDRVVIGSDDGRGADVIASLWVKLGGELLECDVASAEMIKLASNAFLATKISFINEIANVCEAVGADANLVAIGMGLDHRIGGAFLRPGVGFGGSCFGKDVNALKQVAANVGYHFHLLSGVLEVNALQKRRAMWLLEERLGSLHGRRIAVLGLAFKPGTDDMRDAPSLTLIAGLLAAGATVVAHDPAAAETARRVVPAATTLVADVRDALDGADAVVIMTEWPEYQRLVSNEMRELLRRPLLVDGRNMLDPAEAASVGWEWVGIGRPGQAVPARHDSEAALLDLVALAG
jgi:UDPglucose 6-dehydrogenase